MNDPTQTSFQAILASGRKRYMSANITVNTRSETTKFTPCHTPLDPAKIRLNAALTARDTIRRKPKTISMPREMIRFAQPVDDAEPGLRLDIPDSVQRSLELGEHAGGGEKEQDQTDDGGDGSGDLLFSGGDYHGLNDASRFGSHHVRDLGDDLLLGAGPARPATAIMMTRMGDSERAV